MDSSIPTFYLTPRQRFDRWYHQRTFDLQSRDQLDEEIHSEDELAVFTELSNGLLAPWSPLPYVAGEIRLLDFAIVPEAREPVFVAVIEIDVEVGMVTLVPAAPYLDPATLFEIVLGNPPDGCDVLQVWNLRRLPIAVLEKSWKSGRLDDADLANTLLLAQASLDGIKPPEAILKFCGRPVVHPADPRRDYVEEQGTLLDHLQALGAKIYFEEEYPYARIGIAASSDKPELPPESHFNIAGTDLILAIFNYEDGWGQITIYDSDGEKSHQTDGWTLWTNDGSLWPISKGSATCRFESLLSGFGLRDDLGHEFDLSGIP